MNGKQLKNSILQWAIQGKLVPQNPNDEPASVLLDKIRQEKERLIKEKKIKRDKNASIIYRGEDNSYYEKILATGEVKCIDEEVPFEIPQGWEWCRVNDLMKNITDGTHRSPTNTDNGEYMYITAKNIKEDGISLANISFVSKDVHDEIYSRCNPEYGDLLYIKDGATTGIVTINNIKKPFSLLSSVALLKPTSKINANYILYFLRTPLNVESVRNSMKGCAITRITLRQIEKWLVPVPPLEEQQRIVDLINELLPYLDKYSTLQMNLDLLNVNINDKLKKSILQEAIQGKLVSQKAEEGTAQKLLEQIKVEKQKLVKEGKLKKSALNDSVIFCGDDNKYYTINKKERISVDDEIPFDIPNTWEWCRLGTLFSHCTGKALNASNQKGELMTYITTSNLYWDRFELDNLKQMRFTDEEIEKCTATFGDLLVCEGGDIGRAAIWNYQYDIRIQNHIHKLRAYKQVCTKFFFWVFYFYKATGRIGGKGIGIQGLSSKALDNILIPLPPFKEQLRIVAQIEKLFE